MSIIRKEFDRPQEPEHVKRSKAIRIFNTQMLEYIKKGVLANFALVWDSPDPQAVLNEFGKDARTLFEANLKIQELIKIVDPNWEIMQNPKKLIINKDGTITII